MKKFTQVLGDDEKIRREVRLVLALVQQVSESIAGAADAEWRVLSWHSSRAGLGLLAVNVPRCLMITVNLDFLFLRFAS